MALSALHSTYKHTCEHWKTGGRGKKEVSFSFCHLVLVQISIKLVKQTSLSAAISQGGWYSLSICKVLGASVHPVVGWPAFPGWQVLFQDSSSMRRDWVLRSATCSRLRPDHLQESRRNSVKVHQLKHTKPAFLLLFFWIKLFSWKIYEHVYLTPCCTWQLPASSLHLGCLCFQVLCLSRLKTACLGIVKYLKPDLSCPSPPVNNHISTSVWQK